MKEFLTVSKALADQTRLRTLLALQGGELCLCQLIDLLGLAPSTVSKHLNVLHEAGLVDRRKEGRWAYFRLADEQPSATVRRALRFVAESLKEDATGIDDRAALKTIVKKDLAQLCECYS